MRDSQKTRKQLIKELQETQQQLAVLAASEVERRRMVEALRESEEKFSMAFRSSPDMIIIGSLEDGRYIEVNDSFIRITGYTREELIGHTVLEFNIWVYPEELDKMNRLLTDKGAVRDEEFSFRMKSGEIRVWLCSAEIIDIGSERCTIAVATDITERKRAEEALRENQEFISSLLEKAPDQIVVINPDTSIQYVNPAFEETNGWTAAEVIGIKAPYPWWPEETREELINDFNRAMQSGSGQAETISVKKNGERYWISLNWSSIMHDGKLLYLLVNARDITVRKNTEAALLESEEKFSKAFLSSPASIIICTRGDGRFVEVNDSFTRLTGYTREDVIGRTAAEIGNWLSREDRARMLRILEEKGHVYNEEFKFRKKSGKIQTMILSAAPITIGGEQCVISTSADLTELRRFVDRWVELEAGEPD